MIRKTKTQMGYLLPETMHDQVMRALDSLRLIEGLVCMSRAGMPAAFDMDDLAGFLQLLLEQTHKPLKSLEYQRWASAGDDNGAQPEPKAAPVDEEAELLRNYRTLPDADRQHLRRCAEALASVASKEAHQ